VLQVQWRWQLGRRAVKQQPTRTQQERLQPPRQRSRQETDEAPRVLQRSSKQRSLRRLLRQPWRGQLKRKKEQRKLKKPTKQQQRRQARQQQPRPGETARAAVRQAFHAAFRDCGGTERIEASVCGQCSCE
jgi:hypothetical protein